MIVRVEPLGAFFARGDEIAKKVDQGLPLEESCIRSFEDPEDLLALFTSSRRELLAEVLRRHASIDALSMRLQREVSELENDVRVLVDADIFTFDNCVVQAVAETVVFEPIAQFVQEV